MKQKYTQLLFGTFLLVISGQLSAQTVFFNLDEVFLNCEVQQEVSKNTFSNYHTKMLSSEAFKLRKEIRKSKKTNEQLVLASHKTTLQVATANYLKILKKGANKSDSFEAFSNYIKEHYPELNEVFYYNNVLPALYTITRPQTFNGKIDALPSVL